MRAQFRKSAASLVPEALERRLLLSTHRTAVRYHYVAPAVYVRRRGPRHSTAASATPTPSIYSVGQSVDLTQASGNEMESQVAVNPTNPNNIAMIAQNDVNGGNVLTYSVSQDGGASWVRTGISSDDDGYAASTPRADARLIFDAYGNLYGFYMVATGPGQVSIVCLQSSDGGQTVTSSSTPVPGASYNADSPWLATGVDATDPSRQRVWMSFTDLASRHVMVTGVSSAGLGDFGTWSKPTIVSDKFGTYSGIAVGPEGQLAVAWQQNEFGQGPTPLLFDVDPTGTGKGFGKDRVLLTTNVGGFDYIPAQAHRSIDAEVKLAFDNSDDATRGRLYLAYTDEPVDESNDTNIYLRYSDNLGTSWTRALKVNDDTGTKSQFLPALAVDRSTGDVGLSWYDARNSADNTGAELYAAVSTDHGATFNANVQVAAGLSNQNWKGDSSNDLDYGDNNSLGFADGKLIAVWSDNSATAAAGNPDGSQSTLDVDLTVVTVKG